MLVVITMLMLIVFGLLALTSALAFERLGRKAVVWAGEYYELDARATERVQLIDESLCGAELAAREYIAAGEYAAAGGSLEVAAQAEISRRFGMAYAGPAKDRMLERIFSRVYFYNAVLRLNLLAETNPVSVELNAPFTSAAAFLTEWEREPGAGDITIRFVESEGAGMKNLSIALTVEPMQATLSLEGGLAGGRNPDGLRRYSVLEWREWQQELPMEDTPFWDGSFENLPDLPPGLEEFEIDDSLPTD